MGQPHFEEDPTMSAETENDFPQDIDLKAAQVRQRYGYCSGMWIERRQKDAGFPEPILPEFSLDLLQANGSPKLAPTEIDHILRPLTDDGYVTHLGGHRYKRTAKPAPAKQAEPPVRYFITPELRDSFSEEQIKLQTQRLMESGRWHLPNNGGAFTMRIALEGSFEYTDRAPEDAVALNAALIQTLIDFEMDGDKVLRITHLVRRQYPGLSADQKQEILGHPIVKREPQCYREATLIAWWERGSWLCERGEVIGATLSDLAKRAPAILDMLVIILQDRSVHRIDVEPREPSAKWKRLGLAKDRPDLHVQDVTLYCPRRVYTGEQGGTHASPRMHYRAEHLRMQPYGEGRKFRKEVTIAAQWINAADVDPAEFDTPIRHVKLVGGEP
jgi:hypothetical protein